MHSNVANSTVLVTGAAGRLGRTLIQHLLESSAIVAGVDQLSADFDSKHFHFFEADLTDERDASRLFQEVSRLVGAVDAVVNTVGMWGGAPFADTDLDDFETILRVNLTSTFLCFRGATRHWTERGRGGHLVALASMQGADRGVAQQAAYSAAKAGVIRLVEAVAHEYGDRGITAAAVAPSMILFGNEPPGTAGVPAAQIASLCAYLASDGAAVHNGAVIRAYGSLLE